MPQDWLWPFHIYPYELPFTNTSHRLAWGANYGAIGQTSVSAFGRTFSGYPQVAYSVFLVVGAHGGDPTRGVAGTVEKLAAVATTNATWSRTWAVWTSAISNGAST